LEKLLNKPYETKGWNGIGYKDDDEEDEDE
jgi:hypothetical protein